MQACSQEFYLMGQLVGDQLVEVDARLPSAPCKEKKVSNDVAREEKDRILLSKVFCYFDQLVNLLLHLRIFVGRAKNQHNLRLNLHGGSRFFSAGLDLDLLGKRHCFMTSGMYFQSSFH